LSAITIEIINGQRSITSNALRRMLLSDEQAGKHRDGDEHNPEGTWYSISNAASLLSLKSIDSFNDCTKMEVIGVGFC